MAFISGNDGYLKIGALSYSFNEWKLNVEPGNKKFFAFGSAFQQTLPGGCAATITATGPYNAGATPLVPGALAEFHLGWATGIEFVVTARLGAVDWSNKIQPGGDPGTVGITADSHGIFAISFS